MITFAIAMIMIIISPLYTDDKPHQMRQREKEDKVKSNEIKIFKLCAKVIKLKTEV
jgi:energy-converting hydrogenase Eha subunit H